MRKALLAIILTALLLPVEAGAAKYRYEGGYCLADNQSALLDLGNDRLSKEIEARYSKSVDVANDQRWIYSQGPTFTWAYETKVACGKAIGYLKRSYVDQQNVYKCDCFYQRMRNYMKH